MLQKFHNLHNRHNTKRRGVQIFQLQRWCHTVFTCLLIRRWNTIVLATRLRPTTTWHFEDIYLLVYRLILILLIVNRDFSIHYFIFHCKRSGIPLSTAFLYLKQNVLYWPDDDRVRSKHVAMCNILHTLYYYIDVVVYWRYKIYSTIVIANFSFLPRLTSDPFVTTVIAQRRMAW